MVWKSERRVPVSEETVGEKFEVKPEAKSPQKKRVRKIQEVKKEAEVKIKKAKVSVVKGKAGKMAKSVAKLKPETDTLIDVIKVEGGGRKSSRSAARKSYSNCF